MLNWLQPFSIFCLLDNGPYATAPHQYDCLAAAGAVDFIEGDDVTLLDGFINKHEWIFGHLSYALKASLHGLTDSKPDKIGFAPYYFFSPEIVLEIQGTFLKIYAQDPDAVFDAVMKQAVFVSSAVTTVVPKSTLSREVYLQKIKALQAHILRGDCYEINFCMESVAHNVKVDPFGIYQKLTQLSPNPFAAFYRVHDKFLMCASPERFLTKRGNRVVSQPIKGTIARDNIDAENDAALLNTLRHSQKDQAENVMVVDLVRNDLTRICEDNSVQVDELFGVYSFPQVHQMISTVSGRLKENILFSEILKATFPMGSMTGAPKQRVMQLIDEYEPSARGIFSGSVGYIGPAGDFDFNVVIRSLMYNATNAYLMYQVGSGITFYSDAEKEWDECLLKAEAIKKVLAM